MRTFKLLLATVLVHAELLYHLPSPSGQYSTALTVE